MCVLPKNKLIDTAATTIYIIPHNHYCTWSKQHVIKVIFLYYKNNTLINSVATNVVILLQVHTAVLPHVRPID